MARKIKYFHGIDLSRWNHVEDFEQIKASGIDFVILKAGGSDYGFYEDSRFSDYYDRASAAGLEIGAYYFAGPLFLGRISGILDAHRFIDILGERKFSYPVFVDIETTPPVYRQEATDAAIGFCEEMEHAGYYVGIYASDISGFRDRLDHGRLSSWAHWVADYTGDTEVCRDWQIRQTTSTGEIPGISNYVDLDISKYNYPLIMKKNHLNKY